MDNPHNGPILMIVRLNTSLSEADLMEKAHERSPEFRAIPGLLQKYYVRLGAGAGYGGIYVWDSRESLEAFRQSDLAATIPKAYQVVEPPQIELMDILFPLRSFG